MNKLSSILHHRFGWPIILLFLVFLLMTACRPPASEPTTATRPAAAETITSQPLEGQPTPTLTALPVSISVVATPAEPTAPATPTLTITATSPPTLTATPPVSTTTSIAGIQVTTTTLTIPTYPFRDYLVEQIDPLYNIPYYTFRRGDYEADQPHPQPIPVAYTAIMLENPYLRLTFLPELGGRLYSAVVKSTGQELFYHNDVVKPSRYGILEPVEANWWLAAGGMEWAYPTQEHGYRWGVPWSYRLEPHEDGVTMILSDMAEGRIGLMVAVTLPTERAYFTVQPALINQTAEAVPVQLWLNGVLALGADSMSRQTRFVIPTEQVTVHSRGPEGWTVPDAHSVMPWPLVGETDLQIYEAWQSYLGLFIPNLDAPFMGAYNPDTDLGVARLITPGAVVGNKLFAFGLAFPDRSYTDDNSQYFEIWGGVNEGFWTEDDIVVEPAGQLSWQEAWWPLAGLGGLTWANQAVAIYLSPATEMDQTLTAHFAQPLAGQVIMIAGGQTLLKESFTATPSQPLTWTFDSPTEPIEITLLDQAGEPRLIYKASP